MDSFEAQILRTVRKHDLLEEGDSVMIGVSGGGDSVALLLAMQNLSGVLKCQVAACHFNHHLRGRESDADQAFVERLCGDLGMDLKVGHASAPPDRNIEDWAREERYSFFGNSVGSSLVATAHTINDQAETLLLRLFRGAGPAGWTAILPRRKLFGCTVIRPLIESTRHEVESYLDRRGQPFREDSSNRNLDLDRNWVRHSLVPMIEKRLNPSLVTTLGRTAELAHLVYDDLEARARAVLNRVCIRSGNEWMLEVAAIDDESIIVQQEVVRLVLQEAPGLSPEFHHVEAVRRLLQAESNTTTQLPGQWIAVREYDHLTIARATEWVDFEEILRIPGRVFVQETGRTVVADCPPSAAGEYAAVLYLDPREQIIVRNRRSGDRFRTCEREKSVKRLFQERRIPTRARSRLLLLEIAGQVAWIEGLEVSGSFATPQDGRSTPVGIRLV